MENYSFSQGYGWEPLNSLGGEPHKLSELMDYNLVQ